MKKTIASVVLVATALLATGCSRKNRNASGEGGGRVLLQNKGSDTLVNVAQAWAEEYKKVNPN
ncbi:MAG TPA: phosphate-binding protein, partial [Sorangium sp.]|nr:phosphate-binding protein [Sorangium sp.]